MDVTIMADYIDKEAALSLVQPDAPEDEKAAVTIATAKKLVRSIVRRTPAADVVPVSELLTLRDALYENDQITMRGLARLNMLIAKYGGYDHG